MLGCEAQTKNLAGSDKGYLDDGKDTHDIPLLLKL